MNQLLLPSLNPGSFDSERFGNYFDEDELSIMERKLSEHQARYFDLMFV